MDFNLLLDVLFDIVLGILLLSSLGLIIVLFLYFSRRKTLNPSPPRKVSPPPREVLHTPPYRKAAKITCETCGKQFWEGDGVSCDNCSDEYCEDCATEFASCSSCNKNFCPNCETELEDSLCSDCVKEDNDNYNNDDNEEEEEEDNDNYNDDDNEDDDDNDDDDDDDDDW